MTEVRPGDIYRDDKGKLWRVIAYCAEPTMTVEEIEPQPPMNPAFAQQIQQSQNTPMYLTVEKRRMTGGMGGSIWNGWIRIWSSKSDT